MPSKPKPSKTKEDTEGKPSRSQTLKSILPKVGFKYQGYFADKETSDAIVDALRAAPGSDTDKLPDLADRLLAEIFQRASERLNILGRVGHWKFWTSCIYHVVPWFRDAPGLTPTHLRKLATHLVQARLRARASPALMNMSAPANARLASAVDAYVNMLRMAGLHRDIPDPDRPHWDATTQLRRPDAFLSMQAQFRLDGDMEEARRIVPAATTGAVGFKPSPSPGDLSKFTSAFKGKRKAKEDGMQQADADLDRLAAGLTNLDVDQHGQGHLHTKRRAIEVEEGDETVRKRIATKVVCQDVLELAEALAGFDLQGQEEPVDSETVGVAAAGQDTIIAAEDAEDGSAEAEPEDPLAGEDIYGIDD